MLFVETHGNTVFTPRPSTFDAPEFEMRHTLAVIDEKIIIYEIKLNEIGGGRRSR